MTRLLMLLVLALPACASSDVSDLVGPTGPVVASQPPATSATVAGLPSQCAYRHAADGQPLPDGACTPGATDPAVTQATIGTTICARGYTRSVRPPVSYTDPLKRELMLSYGATDPASAYELDHLIPLELGGAPRDPHNLWPEPGASPNRKEGVESRLHDLICTGRMALAGPQWAIAQDWTIAGR